MEIGVIEPPSDKADKVQKELSDLEILYRRIILPANIGFIKKLRQNLDALVNDDKFDEALDDFDSFLKNFNFFYQFGNFVQISLFLHIHFGKESSFYTFFYNRLLIEDERKKAEEIYTQVISISSQLVQHTNGHTR